MRTTLSRASRRLGAILAALALAAPSPAAPLPSLSGETLSGREVTLPAALGGQPALVFVAFEQDQQGQIDAWFDGTAAARAAAGLDAWECPVIGDVNVFLRGVITAGMKVQLSEPLHPRVVPIFADRDALLAGLGGGDGRVMAALVDGGGEIVWSWRGAYSAEAGAALGDGLLLLGD